MDSALSQAKKDGKQALENALKAKERVTYDEESSNKLYDIATKAEELAKKHQHVIDDIIKKNKEYKEKSERAHNEAYHAVYDGWFLSVIYSVIENKCYLYDNKSTFR